MKLLLHLSTRNLTFYHRFCPNSSVNTPTLDAVAFIKDEEKASLLGSPNGSVQVECENVSGEKEAVDVSELHKAKDFQLIHVPKGAVSFRLASY